MFPDLLSTHKAISGPLGGAALGKGGVRVLSVGGVLWLRAASSEPCGEVLTERRLPPAPAGGADGTRGGRREPARNGSMVSTRR